MNTLSLEITKLYVVYSIHSGGAVWLANETIYISIDDARKVRDELIADTLKNATVPLEQLPRYFTATLEDFIDEYGSSKYEEGYCQGHEACQYAIESSKY
jgi:hypothetical protein